MKNLLLYALAVNLFFSQAQAQSLSPSVVSTSGAFYSNGSGMLSTTIGEMAMVRTFSSGGSILTQGFQQAFDFGVGIQHLPSSFALNIYPNPSSGDVTIQLPAANSGEVTANVFDAIGKLVFRKTVVLDQQSNTIQISLENLIDGMYVFEIRTRTGQYFSKINLIK